MEFQFNDGGRVNAGFKGKAGDCACRAIAIATGINYKDAYKLINDFAKNEKLGKRKKARSNARTGVYNDTMKKIMESLGWEWVATMGIGSGCKVHMDSNELPSGNIIVRVSKHYAAVIDGVLNDTYDSSRDGSRCVYGYYRKRG